MIFLRKPPKSAVADLGDIECRSRVNPRSVSTFRDHALSAPRGLPDAGTGAARALAAPRARPGIWRQAALAGGLLAAARDADPDAAVRRNLALETGWASGLVDDVAVADLHAEAVFGVAIAALRHDHHAPTAVKGGAPKRGAVGGRSDPSSPHPRRPPVTLHGGDDRLSKVALPDRSAVELNEHAIGRIGRTLVPVLRPEVTDPV